MVVAEFQEYLDQIPLRRVIAFAGVMFFLFALALVWHGNEIRSMGIEAIRVSCGIIPGQAPVVGLWWNKTNQSWQPDAQWPPELPANSTTN